MPEKETTNFNNDYVRSTNNNLWNNPENKFSR